MKRHATPDGGTRRALRELEVRPSKSRGQNFVIDSSVTDAIVEFGAPREGERIVEIGPGLGALTERLAGFSGVKAIEIEPAFCEDLRRRFPNVEFICSDVRQIELADLGEALTVFGNLPYSFSTDIVFKLVDNARALKRAVLLLQREFVERMAASPGGRDYGTLSISCQLWADLRAGPIITGDKFHPPAKVDSRVVELLFRSEPRVALADEAWFKRVVKASFFRRRKKLSNSLAASGMFSHDLIEAGLTQAGVDGGRRAETLSIEEFARLADALGKR